MEVFENSPVLAPKQNLKVQITGNIKGTTIITKW